ncbi:MAG: inositol monophosphatase [Cyclobacteriaceae bacterium]|nr:MAG: inositol monophosphatase [Cyclobacteriaceae bacterium]
MKETDLQKVLPKVIEIVKEGGGFIRQERTRFDPEKLEFKGTNDLVSYVDREAEKILVSGLGQILPEAGFITEEGTVTQETARLQWVIDPLDGTTNFVHGIPFYSVSVALLLNGQPVLGVVYEINQDECFHAIQQGKAYCNDKEIKVSTSSALSDSVITSGYPHLNFDHLPFYMDTIAVLMQQTQGMRRMGSAAADLAYVACGRVSCFFESNLNSYDVAAGALIVQQAGGRVTDFQGGNNWLFGREIIAANGVHLDVLEIIQRHWK